jgi:hypothetical protein
MMAMMIRKMIRPVMSFPSILRPKPLLVRSQGMDARPGAGDAEKPCKAPPPSGETAFRDERTISSKTRATEGRSGLHAP